jgi:hypothetical protein
MSARRPVTAIVVSFILALISVSLGSLRAQSNAESPAASPKAPPLAGANSVSGLHVDQKKQVCGRRSLITFTQVSRRMPRWPSN